MKRWLSMGLALPACVVAAGVCAAGLQHVDSTPAAPSSARAFPYEAGVVDLTVTGAAAKILYDRLPGKGVKQECGATGLHKGDGRMTCAKDGAEHVCHIWLDVPKQALTKAETDDC